MKVSVSDKSVEHNESDEILALLAEYSAKLRESSEQELQRSFKRVTSLMTVGFVLLISLFVSLALLIGLDGPLTKQTNDISSFYELFERNTGTLLSITVALVSVAVSISTMFRFRSFELLRKAKLLDIEVLANLVRRLLEVAVQYREHASNRISVSFEYDLRVAEAEAALSLAARVFGRMRTFDGIGIENFFDNKDM